MIKQDFDRIAQSHARCNCNKVRGHEIPDWSFFRHGKL